MKKICVIGLGYIGLPTACMLANNGYNVIGVDINEEIINKLNSGKVHIDEPELEGIFDKAFKNGRLKVSLKPEKSDAFIISVPTPLGDNNKSDLSYVSSAAKLVSEYVEKKNIVILESTSPPGTTENVVGGIILENRGLEAGKDYYLAFCPERVLPGKLVYELVNNDRVIGGIERESAKKAEEIYKSFSRGNIYITDLKTSEFVKLAENTYRDINLAFANELLSICNKYCIDIWEVIDIANRHPRVNILQPGPGVGGHCIPIDPWFILENIDIKDTIIEKARNINDSMPLLVFDRINNIINGLKDPKVTIFGASYKENVDDSRESPSGVLYNLLSKASFSISVFDPLVKHFKYDLSGLEESCRSSDLIVLMVGHTAFRDIDLELLSGLMRNKNILDTRNFFNKEKIENSGFNYYRL